MKKHLLKQEDATIEKPARLQFGSSDEERCIFDHSYLPAILEDHVPREDGSLKHASVGV